MNTKKAAEYIRRTFPDRALDAVSFFGEGDFYRAYLVDGEWVFRFAKHAEAARALEKEYRLLPKIADRLTLEIPRPELVSFTSEPAFSAYRLLEGRALTQEVYLSFDAEKRTSCARRVAGFLNELQAIDPQIATSCGVAVCDYRAQYEALGREAEEYLCELLDAPARRFVEETINAYLASPRASFAPKLLHGDLSPDHILFNERTPGVCGIIDFGDAMVGDAAWDLVWLYEDYGLDFLARLLPTLAAAAEPDLLVRVFEFSKLQAIEWTVNCRIDAAAEFDEALGELLVFSREAGKRFDELMTLAGRV